jgi:hypothetical protein
MRQPPWRQTSFKGWFSWKVTVHKLSLSVPFCEIKDECVSNYDLECHINLLVYLYTEYFRVWTAWIRQKMVRLVVHAWISEIIGWLGWTVCVCACVCVCVFVCVWERESVCVCVCASLCV